MRKYGKVDANQPAIVRDLRKLGYSVLITSDLGEGAPDLVVGKDGRNILVELKDPNQPPSKRRLTKDEKLFHDFWRGCIVVAETVEEIISGSGA